MTLSHSEGDTRKLTVLFRVEPGSLGPDGVDHVEGFCQYANEALAAKVVDHICWSVVPRNDKSLPELEYQVEDKKLTNSQVERYLVLLGQSLDELEDGLTSDISRFIGEYLRH